MELLQLLNMTAASGRLVIITIHQPRLEIFHMFDIILLLCQGKVSKKMLGKREREREREREKGKERERKREGSRERSKEKEREERERERERER